MRFPAGVSEKDVLDAIENAVRLLAPSFAFGIYGVDDIKQEGRKFGLEAMSRYDTKRPLENFLYSHIRNRLINLKRDEYRRSDAPCLLCHAAEGGRSKHASGEFCRTYVEWKKRNDTKASLMQPLNLEYFANEENSREATAEDTVELNEMLRIIDEQLEVELRSTYLQMRAGKKVPKVRRLKVEQAVQEILRDAI